MLQTVKRQPLSRQVLRSLRDYIEDRNLQPGDRLPTERELAAELQVSRNTVRESLGVLEAIGVVKRQPKLGAVLQPPDLSLLGEVTQFLMRSRGELEHLFEARRTLEISLIPLIVAHAKAEDYARMEAAIAEMEKDIVHGGLGTEGDVAFHHALLRAAGNSLLMQFGSLIQEFFKAPRTRMLLDSEKAKSSIADHRAIVSALRNGDIEAAQQAMERHLGVYDRRIFGHESQTSHSNGAGNADE